MKTESLSDCSALRKIALAVGIALSLSSGVSLAQAGRPTPPNILVLFVDDLGWADLKYRTPPEMIPQITRLGEESRRFVNAYAASPTCSPSRASVVTGQHPARLKLVRHIPSTREEFHTLKGDPAQMPSRNWLPLEVKTYADALKPLGYTNVFFGKWHLGPERFFPIQHGFDAQFGVTDQGNPRGYYPPYFPDSCPTYRDAPRDKFLTDRLTDDVVAYIDAYQQPNPIQLSVFYYAVHAPLQGRRDLLEKLPRQYPELKGPDLQRAAMLGAVDESIGRIREALVKRGRANNTLIVFAGDQGGPLRNAPLRGSKTGGEALYEGGARIPFFIHWPGAVAPGISAEPVMTTDIFPTILQAAGGEPAKGRTLDGESLIPLLTKGTALRRQEIVLYRSYEDQYASIRAGEWKLIAYRSGKMELFRPDADLSETNELSAQRPQMVRELAARLFAWEETMGVDYISGCRPEGSRPK